MNKPRRKKYGNELHPLYTCWINIKQRCYNPNCSSYPWYGGCGITVCKRWRRSFADFASDMGDKPTPQHSIDRIDPSGNYCPENCRWATRKQQARNAKNNRLITIGGVTRTLSGWCEVTGVSPSVASARIVRYGWDEEKAIKTTGDGRSLRWKQA